MLTYGGGRDEDTGCIHGREGTAEALHAVAELQKELGRAEASLVRKARQAGLPWEAITLCLGVSKQAVHRKYGKR